MQKQNNHINGGFNMQVMFSMTYATMDDKLHFVNQWENLPESEFESKIRDKRYYVMRFAKNFVGESSYAILLILDKNKAECLFTLPFTYFYNFNSIATDSSSISDKIITF